MCCLSAHVMGRSHDTPTTTSNMHTQGLGSNNGGQQHATLLKTIRNLAYLNVVYSYKVLSSASYTTPPSPSHPGYFGKVGMRHFHVTRNKYYCPTVNLDKLWSLVSERTREVYKDRADGKAPVIDVVRHVS